MELIELPYLSVGSPSKIALPCVSQIKMRDLLEAPRRVKTRGQLVGERHVVDKPVVSRRADGSFIQMLSIEHAALDPGDLGADQRGAVLEVFRAIGLPHAELLMMAGQCIDMLLPLLARNGVAKCGAGERGVELIFRAFPVRRRGPDQPLGLG